MPKQSNWDHSIYREESFLSKHPMNVMDDKVHYCLSALWRICPRVQYLHT